MKLGLSCYLRGNDRVYLPSARKLSWGSGFLSDAGFIDFAGSGIVHMCGAAAALAGVLLLALVKAIRPQRTSEPDSGL